MRAIGLMNFGGPEVLQPVDMLLQEPGPGEVRIGVHAAAVNPTDVIFRSGGGQARLLGARRPPFVPGMDAAGQKVAVTVSAGALGGYVIQLAKADGVTVVADAAPADTELIRSLGAIADGGGLAEVRGWAGPSERNIAVHTIVANSVASDTRRLEQVGAVAELGRLTLRVAEVLPAERAADAHRRRERGDLRGRLVLDFTQ